MVFADGGGGGGRERPTAGAADGGGDRQHQPLVWESRGQERPVAARVRGVAAGAGEQEAGGVRLERALFLLINT
mgnify:CR=1 FL=1